MDRVFGNLYFGNPGGLVKSHSPSEQSHVSACRIRMRLALVEAAFA